MIKKNSFSLSLHSEPCTKNAFLGAYFNLNIKGKTEWDSSKVWYMIFCLILFLLLFLFFSFRVGFIRSVKMKNGFNSELK